MMSANNNAVYKIADFCDIEVRKIYKWIKTRKNYLIEKQVTQTDLIKYLEENTHDIKTRCFKSKIKKDFHDVLIVDDHPMILNVLSEAFYKNGFKVDTAHDGVEALYFLKTRTPRIITLDLKMDNMTGLEFLKITTALKLNNSHSWIIVISGDSREGAMSEAISQGADFYLSKPFSINDLEKIIRKLTQKSA